MDAIIVITTFAVIFLGELPDKTMFASLVLSTRGRPALVWLGAAAAFAIHVVIAVSVGITLFRVLPHRILDAAVCLMFAAGAALAAHEALTERRVKPAGPQRAANPVGTPARIVATAFTVVFLAEWGDLTQILTANLAARYHAPLAVSAGAVLGLWAVCALAVVGGSSLVRWVDVKIVRIVTAVVLGVLAVVTGWLAMA